MCTWANTANESGRIAQRPSESGLIQISVYMQQQQQGECSLKWKKQVCMQ